MNEHVDSRTASFERKRVRQSSWEVDDGESGSEADVGDAPLTGPALKKLKQFENNWQHTSILMEDGAFDASNDTSKKEIYSNSRTMVNPPMANWNIHGKAKIRTKLEGSGPRPPNSLKVRSDNTASVIRLSADIPVAAEESEFTKPSSDNEIALSASHNGTISVGLGDHVTTGYTSQNEDSTAAASNPTYDIGIITNTTYDKAYEYPSSSAEAQVLRDRDAVDNLEMNHKSNSPNLSPRDFDEDENDLEEGEMEEEEIVAMPDHDSIAESPTQVLDGGDAMLINNSASPPHTVMYNTVQRVDLEHQAKVPIDSARSSAQSAVSDVQEDTDYRQPCILADLNMEDRKLQFRYFYSTQDPKSISLNDAVHCLVCAKSGHTSSDCPTLTCAICGVFNQHVTRTCPKRLKCSKCCNQGHEAESCPYSLSRIDRQEIQCDLCGQFGHQEVGCELLWRTSSLLGTLENAASFGRIRFFCYNCGGSGHLGNDCPTRQPRKPMGSSTWTMPTSMKARTDLPGKHRLGMGHRPARSSANNGVHVEEDVTEFLRPPIPQPTRHGQILIAGGARLRSADDPRATYWPPPPQYSSPKKQKYKPTYHDEQRYDRGRYDGYRR